MDSRSASYTETLMKRIETVRDDIVEGAPITFAFRSRRRLVISERIILACWTLLGAFVLPALLITYTSLAILPVVVLSPAIAQLVTAMLGRGSTRALGLTADGSVIVARVGWSTSKVRGIEKVYQSPTIIIEPTTPKWRTQRVFIDDDVWFHCEKRTHFVRRDEAAVPTRPTISV